MIGPLAGRPWAPLRAAALAARRACGALGAVTLLACTPPAPPAPPPPPPAAPVAPAAPAGKPEGLCPALCALRPAQAGPPSLFLKKLAFRSLDGVEHTHESLAGKVILLHFWSEPRPDIMQELPELARLARGLADRPALVVSASVDSKARAEQAFRELLDGERPFPQVAGTDAAQLAAPLVPEHFPVTYVIDGQGGVRARLDGSQDWRSPEVKRLVEGLAAGDGCSLEFDGGQPRDGGCAPAR